MATLAFLNYELERRGIYDSFWSFVLSSETGVIGTAAGVTLGIATAALAYVTVIGFFVPLLAYTTTVPIRLVNKKWSARLTSALFGEAHPAFEWGRVWHFVLMWVLVVIIVFIVLEGLRRLARSLMPTAPRDGKHKSAIHESIQIR